MLTSPLLVLALASTAPSDPVSLVRQELSKATTPAQALKALKGIDARIGQAPTPEAAKAWLVGKFMLQIRANQKTDAGFVALLKERVPAPSAAWGVDPDAILYFVNTVLDPRDPATEAWLAGALEGQPDGEVRARLLNRDFMIKHVQGDAAGSEAALKRLRDGFPGHRLTRAADTYLENEAKTAPGTQAPAFKVAALGAEGLTYDNATFQGKVVLIDFWATWCGPCRGEMPHLHKAWDRFKGKPFEILSLSVDRKVEDIAAYRKQPGTAMPWKHAFLEGATRAALTGAFGVTGFPKAILLGPDGRIITARPADLRGDQLEKTLARALGD